MSFLNEMQHEWLNIFFWVVYWHHNWLFASIYLASMCPLHKKKNDFAFDRRSSEEVKYPSIFFLNSDYTKVQKSKKNSFIHITTLPLLIRVPALSQIRCHAIFHRTWDSVNNQNKIKFEVAICGFLLYFKTSEQAKIIKNDMIYLEPRDWLTSRKILRDLELFAKGSNKEIWKTF